MQTQIEQTAIQANGTGKEEFSHYQELLDGALALSPELRAMLVQRVVASLVQARPRNVKALMEWVRTRPRGTQPPPTDAEVEEWLEEHRLERYG
jgi:hypothetical protein